LEQVSLFKNNAQLNAIIAICELQAAALPSYSLILLAIRINGGWPQWAENLPVSNRLE
jgi:hypothetical protein